MHIELPYGKATQSLSVPDSRPTTILRPQSGKISNSATVLSEALENPLESPALQEFVRPGHPLLIVVNDAARNTPTADVLQKIQPVLSRCLVRFLMATGTHRPPDETELRSILGPFYSSHRSQIHIHDCHAQQDLREIGITPMGTRVLINRRVAEASKILVIGSVEPHYFAGFTGGRKGLIPGAAGFETIEQNHSHAMSGQAQPMKLDGNPVHEDMAEAVALVKQPVFSIQVVLDVQERICAAFAGDLTATLTAAAHKAGTVYGAPVPEQAEIVVAVAVPPLDANLYQAQKALEHARLAVRPGGVLILVSACTDGIGPDHFYRLLTSGDDKEQILGIIRRGYRLGHHKAANWIRLSRQVSLYGVTALAPEILQSLDMRPFSSVQEAFDTAFRKRKGSVLIMPSASLTVPVSGQP